MRLPLAAWLVVGATLGGAGCSAAPLDIGDTHIDGGVSGDAASWFPVPVAAPARDKVDVLFMIDDSGSMQPKQKALRDRFPQLLTQLDSFAAQGAPARYHIGVVTSDLGAPGIDCPYDLGGKLQAIGAAAPPGCKAPTGGAHYLVYDQKEPSNDNAPAGQDLAQTFACMTSVTSDDDSHVGCAFESQLESVYKALHDPIADNAGFLRDDALLLVVWLTDEDDCSADPHSRLFSDVATYGNQTSFKCTRFGITCDGLFPLPTTPMQSYASCSPATPAQGSALTDVQKYIDFFTLTSVDGGLKREPRDIVLAAIDAPATPFGTSATSDANLCGPGVASCTVLKHSCVATSDPTFFGDPAVRINTVVHAAPNDALTSICGADYADAFGELAGKLVEPPPPVCLAEAIADPDTPDCVARDVTPSASGTMTIDVPACDAARSIVPCWTITSTQTCPALCDPQTGTTQQLAMSIHRGGLGWQPLDTTTLGSCRKAQLPATPRACK